MIWTGEGGTIDLCGKIVSENPGVEATMGLMSARVSLLFVLISGLG